MENSDKGAVLRPKLLNTFAFNCLTPGDMDSEIECTPIKSADNTELRGKTDPDRLGRWAHMNLVKVKKANCTILHLGKGNPDHKYRLGNE